METNMKLSFNRTWEVFWESKGKQQHGASYIPIFGKQSTQMDSREGGPLSPCGTTLQTSSDQIICLFLVF